MQVDHAKPDSNLCRAKPDMLHGLKPVKVHGK